MAQGAVASAFPIKTTISDGFESSQHCCVHRPTPLLNKHFLRWYFARLLIAAAYY